MKASITKAELDRTLSIVSKGMSTRSTLPILSGVHIHTTEDSLIFQTTDLEISIKSEVKSFIEEEGEVVVSGKLLSSIVKSLPDAAITLSTEREGMLHVECGNTQYNLVLLDAEDFPAFPEINPDKTIKVPSGKLSGMVRRVGKVVSRDESRAVLTGILFSVEQQRVRLVATDSYRLAFDEQEFNMDSCDPLEMIIPGKTFSELMKNAENEEYVVLGDAENQIVFQFGNTTLISRKISGKYPNYKQLIPSESKTTAIVPTEQLIDSVKKVSILSQSHLPIRMTLSAKKQVIHLAAQSTDLGTAEDMIEAEVQGEEIQIGFNHQYILDGLSSIDSDNVIIEMQESLKPGIFKSENQNFFYLAMPVRLG